MNPFNSEKSYRLFTNLTSDFVYICSRNGAEPYRIQWTGGALNEIAGYSAADIFALGSFIDFVHSEDRAKLSQELDTLVAGDIKIFDFRMVAKNGDVRWIAQKCRCEKGESEGEVLLYSSLRDITKRKQMEDALQCAFAELQRHDSRMRLLHEMNDKLLTLETRKEICSVIVDSAEKLLPEYSGLLAVSGDSTADFEIVANWGRAFDTQVTYTIEDCWALTGKIAHKVCPPAESRDCKIFQGKKDEPHFCLPLVARGQTIGLLQIISPENTTADQLNEAYNFAVTMSETITLALSNQMLHETLREEAIRDPLTGLFNRRYLEETLGISLRHHQRSNESLTVAMLDLDHFKIYNDSYGHEAGDAVLSEIGALLRNSLRGGDIACRYGGEELTIILTGATRAQALLRLDSIREMIAELSINSGGRQLPPVTISIGIAEAQPDETDATAILKRADGALYQAKQQGRNRIIAE
jgi:diguanylate cyclase (GGDEF)-like protein/PAS domain S-box-containing protein